MKKGDRLRVGEIAEGRKRIGRSEKDKRKRIEWEGLRERGKKRSKRKK